MKIGPLLHWIDVTSLFSQRCVLGDFVVLFMKHVLFFCDRQTHIVVTALAGMTVTNNILDHHYDYYYCYHGHTRLNQRLYDNLIVIRGVS